MEYIVNRKRCIKEHEEPSEKWKSKGKISYSWTIKLRLIGIILTECLLLHIQGKNNVHCIRILSLAKQLMKKDSQYESLLNFLQFDFIQITQQQEQE